MLVAAVLFALTYLVVSGVRPRGLPIDRTSGALVGATAMAIATRMGGAAWTAVSWPTIGLLLGMMIVTGYLVEAGLFRWLAFQTVRRARTARRLLVTIVAVAGALSALLVNDTVCVMFTPLVVAVVDEAGLPPLPFLLALASASNIGGVVSYTGNPQNMIVGTHAPIPFGGYLVRMLPVGVLGLALDGALLAWLFRRELPTGELVQRASEPPPLDGPLLSRAIAALAIVVAGFLLGQPLAATALAGASLLVVVAARRCPPSRALARVDFPLLLFFAALFVVVGGLARSGALERAFAFLAPRLGHGADGQLTVFAVATVIGSNVFSNVPFVLLAVDFVPRLADPTHAWLVLAMASTLAGNLTIFGSVANLIVLELAGRHGQVGFLRFLRYGAIITLTTVALGLAVILVEARLGF